MNSSNSKLLSEKIKALKHGVLEKKKKIKKYKSKPEIIAFRVTQAEYLKLLEKSVKLNIPLSEYVRSVLFS